MNSSDFRFGKLKPHEIEELEKRTAEILRQYKEADAAEIDVALPGNLAASTGLVTLRIRKNFHKNDVRDSRILSIHQPATHYRWIKDPNIVFISFSVTFDDNPISRRIVHERTKRQTEIHIELDEIPDHAGLLSMTFSTPSIYRVRHDWHQVEPFHQSRLDLILDAPFAERTILRMTFPSTSGLRHQSGNCEFLSFPVVSTTVESNTCYYLFFPEEVIKLTSFFGETDAMTLNAPGLPLASAGVGLLLLSMSLFVLEYSKLNDLAAGLFLASLLPQTVQFWIHARVFWPDADRPASSLIQYSAPAGFLCFALGLVLTILVLLNVQTLFGFQLLRIRIAYITLVLGLTWILLFGIYKLLLWVGFLQGYVCDANPEHRIWMRRWAPTQVTTRSTSCRRCRRRAQTTIEEEDERGGRGRWRGSAGGSRKDP